MSFVFENPSLKTLTDKKLFIFDMDGTIYLGNRVFDFAVRLIRLLRAKEKTILFFTNNASHTAPFYMDKLAQMGFEPRQGEMMTSGDVTAEFLLRHRSGKSVYLVGTQELQQDFAARGVPLAPAGASSADIVVTSFDTELTYAKLNDACRLVRNGAEYLSTHPDFNCPTETGFIPDSGAIASFVTASTGKKPVYFGKPYEETITMIGEATGFSRNEMVVFGDRLYTDIAIGKKYGVTAVLVLTGETQLGDVEAAALADRPDYVFPSLGEVADLFS